MKGRLPGGLLLGVRGGMKDKKTPCRFRQDDFSGGSDLIRTDDTPGMNRML